MCPKEKALMKFLKRFSIEPRWSHENLVSGKVKVSCAVFAEKAFGVSSREKIARGQAAYFMLKRLKKKEDALDVKMLLKERRVHKTSLEKEREVFLKERQVLFIDDQAEGWKPEVNFIEQIDKKLALDEYGFQKCFLQARKNCKKPSKSVNQSARDQIISRWSNKVSENTKIFRKRFIEQLLQ